MVAEIAQLVERGPEKPCVSSSILFLGTRNFLHLRQMFEGAFFWPVPPPSFGEEWVQKGGMFFNGRSGRANFAEDFL